MQATKIYFLNLRNNGVNYFCRWLASYRCTPISASMFAWRPSVDNRLYDVTRPDDVTPEVVALDTGTLFSQSSLPSCLPLTTVVDRRSSVLRNEIFHRTCFSTCLPSFLPGWIECFRSLRRCRRSFTAKKQWGDRPPAGNRVETKELAEIIKRRPATQPTRRFSLLLWLPVNDAPKIQLNVNAVL